jgi:hypothetical protein
MRLTLGIPRGSGEKETKRLNKQSMRRALVASAIIIGLLVWWLAANIRH